MEKKLCMRIQKPVNPFAPNLPFLSPLKTSENIRKGFLMFSENSYIGNKWVKHQQFHQRYLKGSYAKCSFELVQKNFQTNLQFLKKILNNFKPMFYFYTPRKHQKTVILTFSLGIEMKHLKIGYKILFEAFINFLTHYKHRRIKNPVEHLRQSFFEKIVNG